MSQEPSPTHTETPRQLPLDGSPVWYHDNGVAWRTREGAVAHMVQIGPPSPIRMGYEKSLPPASDLGMPDMQRGHTIGAEVGAESPYGLTYEHKSLNQSNSDTLSKRDVETMWRRLYEQKPSNVDLYLVTETSVKPSGPGHHNGACLDTMHYEVWARQRGSGEPPRTLKEIFQDQRQMKRQSRPVLSGSIQVNGDPQRPKITSSVTSRSEQQSLVTELARRPERKRSIRRKIS